MLIRCLHSDSRFRINCMTDRRRDQLTRSLRPHGRGLSLIGILGELLITTGVLVFLFLGWQLWLNDLIVGGEQDKAGLTLSHSLSGRQDTSPVASAAPVAGFGVPVIAKPSPDAKQFGVIYIPRFGPGYVRSVSEGVETAKVLDLNGIGHYPGTQMPGEVGNFAVAAHRTTHGAPFKQIATLRVGDKIYVQTADGYYTYVFRGLEYVRPGGVGVLDAVPQLHGVAPTDRIMTMTSCNPEFYSAERIVAYSVLESWQPTAARAPLAIQATIAARS